MFNQKGFSQILLIGGIALLVLFVTGAYLLNKTAAPSHQLISGPTGTPSLTWTPIPQPTPLSDVLGVSLPAGWSKEDAGDREGDTANYTKTLGSLNYRTSFQVVLGPDPFHEPGRLTNASLLNQIKTKRGTTIYVVKDSGAKTQNGHTAGFIYASSCKPTQKSACTIPLNQKLLFVILYPWIQGGGSVQGLNLDDPNTNTVIGEFAQIVQSANL